MTPKTPELWEESAGFLPNRVTVYENAQKGGVLYLRWRSGGNWKRRSLGVVLRDERGRVLTHVREMARSEAMRQYEQLSGKGVVLGPEASKPQLTLADTWSVVSDAKTGLYPKDTAHRREVARALRDAVRIWKPNTRWDAVDKAMIRALGRTRIDELLAKGDTGYRGAEVTVARVLAVGAWLRDEEHIATSAAVAPKRWRDELRTYWRQATERTSDPEPMRPRHTLEELRSILKAAPSVDPRLALALEMGTELRLGQILRCRRSDLELSGGTLTVRGAGKKRGTIVRLTGGQLQAIRFALSEGYLSEMESALPDFPLFPAGKLHGVKSGDPKAVPERHGDAQPIDTSAVRGWFREAEEEAGVPHVKGRGWYGLKRVSVDEAKRLGVSREGLMSLGGWTDTQMPDKVYAEQDAGYARDEAMEVRAKIRGEAQ